MPKRAAKKEPGFFRKAPTSGDPDVRVADFSYQNDALADLIVRAWTDVAFQNGLLTGTPPQRINRAEAALKQRGIYLTNPIVLSEQEFNEGWDADNDDEVVFVLPNISRATTTAGTPLLETAKLLMACTPNGI
jgi:hypothetical protein